MGTTLNNNILQNFSNSFIVYDLEFCGDIRTSLTNCYIFNLAAVELITGKYFKVPAPIAANAGKAIFLLEISYILNILS